MRLGLFLVIAILLFSCVGSPDSPSEAPEQTESAAPSQESAEAVEEAAVEPTVEEEPEVQDEPDADPLEGIDFSFPAWEGFSANSFDFTTRVDPSEQGDNIWIDLKHKEISIPEATEIDRTILQSSVAELMNYSSIDQFFQDFGEPRMMGFHSNPWSDGYFAEFFYGGIQIIYSPAESYEYPYEIRFSNAFYELEVNGEFRTGISMEEILGVFPQAEAAESGVFPDWGATMVLYSDFWSEGSGFIQLEEGLNLFFHENELHSVRVKRNAQGGVPDVQIRLLD